MTSRLIPRRLRRSLFATVRAILAELPDEVSGPGSGAWSVHEARPTDTGIAVVKAGRVAGETEIVVKVATAARVGAQLRRHWGAARALRADPRLAAWGQFVPEVLATGETDGMCYVVERAFSGVPATTWLGDEARRGEVLKDGLSTIAGLHRLTSDTTVVDDDTLERWLTIPLNGLRRLGRPWRGLERIGGELREFLSGRSVEVSWIHGDYWPGNVLVDEASLSLRGVVDWECAADGELPAHDVFHFVLFTRSMLDRTDLGLLVRDLLRGRASTGPEREQLEQAVPHGDPEWFRTVLLLYWLRHLAAHLSQPATGTNRWVWARRNVTPVLRVA